MAAGYEPHPVQAEAHEAFLSGKYDRGTIFWGRRVGKTLFSIWQGIIAGLLEQGDYWYVFDTRQHAKDVLWDKMANTIPQEIIHKSDATELTITFKHLNGPAWIPGKGWQAIKHDPDKLPSKLILSGSDFADRDRGGEANGIIFDEYQDQQPDQWESIYEPFLATTEGWAVFMGTAKTYDHWYELMEDSKRDDHWYHSEGTWRDNPHVSKEFIVRSKKKAEQRGKLGIWLREYELKFMTPELAVYPMFDRKLHIKQPEEIPEDLTWYAVWDFGFAEGHPMAYGLIGIDRWGRWWLTDEIFGPGIDMDEMIDKIRMVNQGKRVQGIVADSARPDLIAYARSKGLNIIEAPKRQKSLTAGIVLLAARLKPKLNETGNPTPDMYITSNCRNAIQQFEGYRYREAKADRPVSEEPLKMNDDMPDAVRYLALYLKYGLTKKKKAIATGIKTDQYGLPVQ